MNTEVSAYIALDWNQLRLYCSFSCPSTEWVTSWPVPKMEARFEPLLLDWLVPTDWLRDCCCCWIRASLLLSCSLLAARSCCLRIRASLFELTWVTWVTWRLLWLLRASETTASIRGWRVARIWEMMALLVRDCLALLFWN